MGAPDLIFKLRNSGHSIKADGNYLDISPASNLPPELVRQLKQSKAEILAVLKLEQQQEARRQKVIAMLETAPDTQRAIHTDTESNPDNIILTVAVRHVATYEMLIPRGKYNPWGLLALVENMGALH